MTEVLLVRSKNGSTVLPDMLKAAKKSVDSISLYETKPLLQKETLLKQHLPDADYLVFSSSSAVQAFIQMYGTNLPDPVKVISIGAVTTKTAETLGIPVFATAKKQLRKELLLVCCKIANKKIFCERKCRQENHLAAFLEGGFYVSDFPTFETNSMFGCWSRCSCTASNFFTIRAES